MKPNPICFTKQKFRFENEGERDFEKKRTNEITYTNLFSLLDVTLYIRASLLFSLYVFAMCVYLLSFCVSAFFFSPPFFFLSFVCPPSIYRDSKGVVSLFFSQLIRSWNSFRQFFLHNSVFHVEPWTTIQLFALFICSICFLNSLFLVCGIPTFPLFRPTFTKPCSLLSGRPVHGSGQIGFMLNRHPTRTDRVDKLSTHRRPRGWSVRVGWNTNKRWSGSGRSRDLENRGNPARKWRKSTKIF